MCYPIAQNCWRIQKKLHYMRSTNTYYWHTNKNLHQNSHGACGIAIEAL